MAAKLLNWHPRCCLSIESHFPLDIMQAFDPFGEGSHMPDRPTTWRLPDGSLRTYNWKLPKLAEVFYHPEPRLHLARAAIAGISSYCFPHAHVFGDKSPFYSMRRCWETVKELLPGARFIVMQRPLEECVESLMRATWWGGAGKDRDEAREMLQAHLDGQEGIPDAMFVELEELQANPEPTLRLMLDWAGLNVGAVSRLEPDGLLRSYPMKEAIAEMREGKYN